MGEPKTSYRAERAMPGREAIGEALLADEGPLVEALIAKARFSDAERCRIEALAMRPRQGGARRPQGERRRRFLPARIWAVERGGGAAALPRRGAAAHPRCRHRRPADRGHDRLGRLVAPSRPLRLGPGQRLDLGADADRAHRRLEREQAGRPREHGPAADRAEAASR